MGPQEYLRLRVPGSTLPAELSQPDPETLMTVDEVAQFLRLKPETVRAMARRGELPAVKLGRVWRFKKSLLSDLLLSKIPPQKE